MDLRLPPESRTEWIVSISGYEFRVRPNPDINVANNWALKVLRVFGAMLLKIHVDLLCWA
jgi:hypothetical protein